MPGIGAATRKDRGQFIVNKLRVGLTSVSTVISALMRFASVQSPVLVAANTTAEQTLTVTGLAVGDVIISVNKPTAQAGLGIVGWRVSAANTLALTFVNATGGGITPTASETYQILVWRP